MRLPASLVQTVLDGSCVAFVGAGFSAAAKLPEWGPLLLEVAARVGLDGEAAEHVRQLVRKGSSHAFDEAAQELEDVVGRSRLLAELKALLGSPGLTPAMARRLELLRGIPFRAILTTNFDGLLPGVVPGPGGYRELLRARPVPWYAENYWLGRNGAPLLKIHGDLGALPLDEGSVVLTRRDYRRLLYQDAAYRTFLRSLMSTGSLLYLGFSFEDAYLNELRSEVLALLGQDQASEPVAWAVVNDVPEARRRHFLAHEGIEVLTYDTRGKTDFSGFDELLAELHERTNPLVRFGRALRERSILWLDPHPENNGPAFELLRRAAAEAGRPADAVVTVARADEALERLEGSARGLGFDLVVTHWGEAQAAADDGAPLAAAERLLSQMRGRDLRCPVLVFAFPIDVEQRRSRALRLGAHGYHVTFESLYRAFAEILGPAPAG